MKMESTRFRNVEGYTVTVDLTDENPTNSAMISKLSAKTYDIRNVGSNQLLQCHLIKKLEMEKDQLIEQNRQINEKYQSMQQKFEELRHQCNNTGFQMAHAPCFAPPDAASRFDTIEQQLTTLITAYNKDKSQMHVLVNAISKMEVYCEEIKVRLSRIEQANASRGWADIHDYTELSTASETYPEPCGITYSRRNCKSLMTENNNLNYSDSNGENNFHPTTSVNSSGTVNRETGLLDSRECVGAISVLQINKTALTSNDAVVSASISMDRRQSDSTTTNTEESGYCDEREEVFDYSDQAAARNAPAYEMVSEDEATRFATEVVQTDNGTETSDNCISQRDNSASVIVQHVYDDAVEIVGEYITPKKAGSSVLQGSVTPAPPKDIKRRPSVFSRSGEESKTSSASSLVLDFDDAVVSSIERENGSYGIIQQNTHRPDSVHEPEISSLNGIFDAERNGSITHGESATGEPATLRIKRKKDRGSNEQHKRIRGIEKAPIKREPGTISIFSRGNSTGSLTRQPSSAPLLKTPPARFKEALKNIKKEREAHALDDSLAEENIYTCICGHRTTTKSGLRLHVKSMGTEEARYKCPWQDCDDRFLFPYLVRNHLKIDHKDSTVPDRLYGCEKCFKIFYDKNNLKTHTNSRNEICKLARRRQHSPARRVSGMEKNQYEPTARSQPSIIITL